MLPRKITGTWNDDPAHFRRPTRQLSCTWAWWAASA